MIMYLIWAMSLVAVYLLKDQIKNVLGSLWDKLMLKIKGQ